MAHPPTWIEVRDLSAPPGTPLIRHLDSGEAEAIQLATDLIAGALIMDERIGRGMAKARNIPVIGILGILLEPLRENESECNLIAIAGHGLFRRRGPPFSKSLPVNPERYEVIP